MYLLPSLSTRKPSHLQVLMIPAHVQLFVRACALPRRACGPVRYCICWPRTVLDFKFDHERVYHLPEPCDAKPSLALHLTKLSVTRCERYVWVSFTRVVQGKTILRQEFRGLSRPSRHALGVQILTSCTHKTSEMRIRADTRRERYSRALLANN